ncbi:MAG: ArnT family glycosyltransferase [Elusimicrobiota bacterium]
MDLKKIRHNLKYWVFVSWSVVILYAYFSIMTLPKVDFIFSILSWSALMLTAIGLGVKVKKIFKVDTVTFLENLCVTLGLGLGVFQVLFIFLGLLGLYQTIYIWSLLFFIGLITWKNIYNWLKNVKDMWDQHSGNRFSFIGATFLIILVVGLAIMFLSSFQPPLQEYSLAVSLGTAKRYVVNGKITSFFYNYSSALSPGMTVFYTAGLLLHGPATARLITFLFLLLSATGIYSMTRKYFHRKIALFGVAITITTPVIFKFYVLDHYFIGSMFFSFMALYSYISWSSRNIQDTASKNGWLILSGLFTAFALSSGLYVMIIPMVIIIMVLGKIYKDDPERDPQEIARITSYYIIPLVAVLIPVGVKNLVSTGNPIFPFFSQEIGADVSFLIGEGKKSLWGYILPLWYLPFKNSLSIKNVYYLGLPFIVFLPGVFLIKEIGNTIKLLLLYTGLYLLIFIFAGRKIMYIYVLIPVLSIITSYIVVNLYGLKKYFYNFIITVFIITLGMNFYFIWSQTGVLNKLVQYFGYCNSQTSEEYARDNVAGYGAMEYLNRETPKDSLVLLLGENRTFYIDRKVIPDGKYSVPPFVDIIKGKTSPYQAYGELKENDIDYIMCNQKELDKLKRYHQDIWNAGIDNIFRLLKENFLELKYNVDGYCIYEL